MRGSTVSLILLTLAGCAQTPADRARVQAREAGQQEELQKELAGLTPGKPTSCINQYPTRQVKAYGPTILYKVSNSLIYRTDTAGGCEQVGRDVLVTQSFTGQLCRGDIARTIESAGGFQTGSCSIGDFVPYRK